ncbi:hypothetical protein BDY17DRAFT_308207 [Neohortaea acidophila]|uniref:BTB domain-containing protein n=1 Tax=Neohortaea acidophila TaxID=245834 RepID=A0A6A6Q4E8_9PEZI|nr:uncharacterized protein BDY17DRAFT_308207 [Neohortaea acidophila]KAF2486836.1 hypothetical protein BDY17DRAFT_308207 [Neohortaea acidophila]
MAQLNDQRADANACMIERMFFIHEGVLDREGTFFYSALRKCWQEGKRRLIELPKDDPESFRLYAQWLYTHEIYVNKPDGDKNYAILIDLYLLGDKILDREFQDCITDALHAATRDAVVDPEQGVVRTYPDFEETIDTLYRNTPKGDPMRRLMVNLYVQNGDKTWLEAEADVNHEFLADVAIALYKR